jgi:hypothetical protein
VTIAADGSEHQRTIVDNMQQLRAKIRKQERPTTFPDPEEAQVHVALQRRLDEPPRPAVDDVATD